MQITLLLSETATFEYAFRLVSQGGEQTGRLHPFVPGSTDPLDAPVVLDVPEGAFDLLLVPATVLAPSGAPEGMLDEVFDRIARKISAAGRDFALRVGIRYRVTGITDGCTLTVTERQYLFDAWDRFNVLELYPVSYVYPEVRMGDRVLPQAERSARNRKEFLSFTKKMTLVAEPTLFSFLVLRPLQIARARSLTRKGKVRRTLDRFYALSEDERADRFRQMEEKF